MSPPQDRQAAAAEDAAPRHGDGPTLEPSRLETPSGSPVGPVRAVAVAAPVDEREREHLRPTHAAAAAAGGDAAAPAGDTTGAATSNASAGQGRAPGGWSGGDSRPTCTVAQLRRFIKSRPWVPMHELRRRFGINGVEDDVSPIRVRDEQLYIGLPPSEARLIAELLGGGDVGYELSLDPGAPVVVGVYPMRPVPRS